MITNNYLLIYLFGGYLFLSALLGLIPAKIAASKGRKFSTWWVYGFFLFVIALVHSMFIKQTNINPTDDNSNYKKCPYCAEIIKKEAIVCRYCGKDLLTETKTIDNSTIKVPNHTNTLSNKEKSTAFCDTITKTDISPNSKTIKHNNLPEKTDTNLSSTISLDELIDFSQENTNPPLINPQKSSNIITNSVNFTQNIPENINNLSYSTTIKANIFHYPQQSNHRQENSLVLSNFNKAFNSKYKEKIFYITSNTKNNTISVDNKRTDNKLNMKTNIDKSLAKTTETQPEISNTNISAKLTESDLIACKILKACSPELLKLNFLKIVDGIIEANKTEMIAKILVKDNNTEKLLLYCLDLNGNLQKVDCEYDIDKVEFSLLPDETKFNIDNVNSYITIAYA